MTEPPLTPSVPYEKLGGEAKARALAERFYDFMDEREPALAALHPLEDGKVSRAARDKFALFLIGWLGGPQTYVERHGHPRLRMRHGHVPVNSAMRDAWLRCMQAALAAENVEPELRAFLEQRFSELADFMRNQPG